jgi:hypothetical protein
MCNWCEVITRRYAAAGRVLAWNGRAPARGSAKLLRSRRTMAGVIPGSELLPVGTRPSLGSLDGRAIRQRKAGQLSQRVQQRIDQLQGRTDPVGDHWCVPVDVSGDQIGVDQQQFLELRVLLAPRS